MNRSVLKLAQQLLRGELRRARRRRSPRAPLLIAVLTIAVFGLTQLLQEPTAPVPSRGAEMSCQLREIFDGDTVAVRCDSGVLRIRVWGIDAPEMGQEPWGQQSRAELQSLLASAEVLVRVVDIDRYGRTVARLYDDGQDVGLALVRQGQAVVYERYNNSPDYRKAQEQARQNQLGIWSEPGAHQEPWTWRRLNPRS